MARDEVVQVGGDEYVASQRAPHGDDGFGQGRGAVAVVGSVHGAVGADTEAAFAAECVAPGAVAAVDVGLGGAAG